MVHRWAWCIAHGKDPWNLPRWVLITQTCGNHACINPDHLIANIDDETLSQLIDIQPVDPMAVLNRDKSARLPILTEGEKTKAALAHRKKTLCTEGHVFRDASPDTPCNSCKAQRMLSADYYEVTPA